jgi:NAD(P)H-nitrite reductase large subunit
VYESKGTVFHRATKVVKIVEKDGKACGVEIEGGVVLEADIVVVGVGGGRLQALYAI